MHRRSARLRPRQGNVTTVSLNFLGDHLHPPVPQVLNECSLHRELDQVEGKEPNNVPHPDDTDPATRDRVDLGEAPVSEASNDGGDKLGDTEGTHEGEGGAFHEEEAVRTGDEDECLGDDGDLEVDDHMDLGVVGLLGGAEGGSERDVELVLEEVGPEDDNNEDDAKKKATFNKRKTKRDGDNKRT